MNVLKVIFLFLEYFQLYCTHRYESNMTKPNRFVLRTHEEKGDRNRNNDVRKHTHYALRTYKIEISQR